MCWQGGVLRISGDGDDRTGAKIKTPKIPYCFKQNPTKYLDQKLNWPQKKSHAAGIPGHYHESSECFEHPKKYLPNFPNPPKTRNLKVQTQKPLASSVSIEIRSTPTTPPPFLHWTLRYTLLYSCSNLAAISCRCLLLRAPRIAIIASSSLPVIERKRKKQRQRARIFK